MAERNTLGQRSSRVTTRLQYLRLPNMISMRLRLLYLRLSYLTGVLRLFRPGILKWSGKTGQRAKMYPTLKTGYTNDEETQFFGQV